MNKKGNGKMKVKSIVLTLIVLVLSTSASASVVTYDITGEFYDLGQLSGSFTYDTVLGEVADGVITTTGGFEIPSTQTYLVDGGTTLQVTGDLSFVLVEGDDLYWLDLDFVDPAVIYAPNYMYGIVVEQHLRSSTIELSVREGTISAQARVIPIPVSAVLFGSGLIGLIGVARRKKT